MSISFADLTDGFYNFNLELTEQENEFFDYSFIAKYRDEIYHRDMHDIDVKTLRENCKRILKATEGF